NSVFERQSMADFECHPPAVLGDDVEVVSPRGLSPQGFLDHPAGRLQLVRRNQLRDVHPQCLSAAVSADALCGFVDVSEVSLEVDDVDQVARVLYEVAIHALAGAERLILLLSFTRGQAVDFAQPFQIMLPETGLRQDSSRAPRLTSLCGAR